MLYLWYFLVAELHYKVEHEVAKKYEIEIVPFFYLSRRNFRSSESIIHNFDEKY